MKSVSASATMLALAILFSLSIGLQSVQASSETNFPIVTAICRLSSLNDSSGSRILFLNVTTSAMAARNIQHSISYSIDGQNTISMPFELRQKYPSLFVGIITGEATLPILQNGSHNVTVYVETISSALQPNSPFSGGSETLYFTLEGQPTISIVTPSPSLTIVPTSTPISTNTPSPSPTSETLPSPNIGPSPSTQEFTSPSISPTPSPNLSPTPSLPPSLSAAPSALTSEKPKSTPNPNQNQPLPLTIIYEAAIVGSVIFTVAAAFVLRKRQTKDVLEKTKENTFNRA